MQRRRKRGVNRRGAELHETKKEASAPFCEWFFHGEKDVSQIDLYNPSTCNHLALQLATHNGDVVDRYQNTMHKNLGEGERDWRLSVWSFLSDKDVKALIFNPFSLNWTPVRRWAFG